ncbi:MAG: formate/nitrite transporter family protein, partial [Oscillospiraceae bacterium]|nr:formate/nitrite transporter family protein [Oscillospiraceae bacterium]
LLCICLKGYSLFTGKVGYLPENHSKEAFKILLCGLFGNIVSTVLLGFAVSFANPALGEAAKIICEAKLSQEALQTFVRAFFCGVLMYMAVSTYREKNTLAGIFFCVPVFILSGFEHSIANMFYFGASGIINPDSVIYLAIVVIGNSVGGMAMPILNILGKGEPKNA